MHSMCMGLSMYYSLICSFSLCNFSWNISSKDQWTLLLKLGQKFCAAAQDQRGPSSVGTQRFLWLFPLKNHLICISYSGLWSTTFAEGVLDNIWTTWDLLGLEVQDFRQKGLEEQHPSSSHPGRPIPLRMWCEPKESKESPKRFQRSEILNSGNPRGNLPRRARQSITGLDHPTSSTGSSTSSMSSRNTTHLWGSPDPASLVTATRY
jgi:hypothetical protein